MRNAAIMLLLAHSVCWGVEHRVKVAIIDTGLPKGLPAHAICKGGAKDFTGSGVTDNMGHATAVSCIATQGIDFKKVCILPVKYSNGQYTLFASMQDSWKYVESANVQYVNYSSAGPAPLPLEEEALQRMAKAKVVVVAAAGNNNTNLDKRCNEWLACYKIKGIRIVGATKENGTKARYSNYGSVVTDWASDSEVPGCGHFTGTSAAAPKILNRLLKEAGYGIK